MGDLCSLQDVELYLLTNYENPSDFTQVEEQIEYLITAVSAEIETICNRKFLTDNYTEVHDSDGRSIYLDQFPVQNISSVKFGSPFGDSDRSAIDTDNYTTDNTIGEIRFSIDFTESPQLFEVIYTAGYDEVPYDLNLICVKEVVRSISFATIKNTNFKSEKLGDYSYTLSDNFSTSSNENTSNLRKQLGNWIKSDI